MVHDLIADSFVKDSHPVGVNHRYSKDKIINERGRKFLDLVSACNMEILNGNMIGDITGNYTCHRYNGSSVVDYMVTSQHLLHTINQFKVMSFSILSDHCPTSCFINSSVRGSTATDILTLEDNPLGFRWKSTTKKNDPMSSAHLFRNAQNSDIVMKMIEEINEASASCYTVNDVNDLNIKLINTFTKIADTTLMKKRKPAKYRNKNVWFDKTCRSE